VKSPAGAERLRSAGTERLRLEHDLRTGARVLAEAIETDEHRERVQRLGCGFGQGWEFGRPVDAAAFGKRLAGSSIRPSATARTTASSREPTPSLR